MAEREETNVLLFWLISHWFESEYMGRLNEMIMVKYMLYEGFVYVKKLRDFPF